MKCPGDLSGSELPLPIPNRVVKATSADGTPAVRRRESRSLPGLLFCKSGGCEADSYNFIVLVNSVFPRRCSEMGHRRDKFIYLLHPVPLVAYSFPCYISPDMDGKDVKSELDSPMARLLEKSKVEVRRLRPGEVAEGIVLSKKRDELILNIGAKAEGIVSGRELEDEAKTFKKLKEGDKVLATVLQAEDNRGYILLSLRRAEPERDWRRLQQAFEKEEVIEIEVLGPNRGGVLTRFRSQRGFIPFSHLSLKNKMAANAGKLVDKTLAVRIIELNRDVGRIVLSEREALTDQERQAEITEITKVKVRETYDGEITSITPFGVFVKFDSLEGMVHVSELSWEKVADPKKQFKIGDGLKVEVIEVNKEEGKIMLSHKKTLPNPWEKVVEKYPEGTKVKGKVTKIADFGAFVELEPGIEGLIHVTETTGPLAEGDEIEARVIEVDPKNQKLALSLKAIGAGWR